MMSTEPAQEFDALIKRFIDAGNIVEGPFPKVTGTFQLRWEGRGSRIVFGPGVVLTNANIQFRTGACSLLFGEKASPRGRFEIGDCSCIEVGRLTVFNRACDLSATEGASIVIGSGCLFSNIFIRTSDMHSIVEGKNQRTNNARDVIIEDGVWIDEFATIYKGVRVGAGSTVAGHAVVTESVPPVCVVAGNPAKVKKAGVRWQRKLIPATKKPTRALKVANVPLNKEVLQELINQKQIGLVLETIQHHISIEKSVSKLPIFAQWYYVKLRADNGSLRPSDEAILRDIISQSPNHKPATELLGRFMAK